jgi:antirestriction protein ArdC
MTFKQALELKAHVRKGEEGSLVVYADNIIRTETNAVTGEEAERAIPFMKGYTVFNVEQIDGLPEHFYAMPAPRTETVRRIERAESFFAATGADVRHGGNRAFYSPASDYVQMPCIEAFRDAESLYAILGLTAVVREDHAAYIACRIKVLKDNKRAIFSAASQAQRAADFLHGLQRSASATANAAQADAA